MSTLAAEVAAAAAPATQGSSTQKHNSNIRGDQLTGQQKVAVVLAQLPTETSASILKALSDEEAVELSTEIANLPALERSVVEDVIAEFVSRVNAVRAVGQGGLDRAKAILAETLGHERAAEVLAHMQSKVAVGPLAFLSHAEPSNVVPLLVDEHPQTVAVVLAHLPAGDAASLLDVMPPEFRAEVVERIATMERVAPEAISQAASVLASKLRGLGSQGSSTPGGIPSLVEILTRADSSTEKQVLAELDARDHALADAVRQKMFTFEDTLKLDDRTLQEVLRRVAVSDLALALKGSIDDRDVLDKVKRNLSERAAKELDEELEVMGPVRLSAVDGAQGNVVRAVRELESEGAITLTRGDDEEMMV
ncbi:MAG TPA: flagellar motor switch protein FliG [Acidimicrobiales bacterium]|nr:flagellar motor switch protein FliG [Acidimicrobiales bacterium]